MTQIYNIFCQISYFYGDLANYQTLLQHTHQIPLHIFVDFAVAGEGTAAFFVAAEGADQVRVLDLFVEVADKAAAGQVGGSHFVERADFLLADGWIIDYDRTDKAGGKERGRNSSNGWSLMAQRKIPVVLHSCIGGEHPI